MVTYISLTDLYNNTRRPGVAGTDIWRKINLTSLSGGVEHNSKKFKSYNAHVSNHLNEDLDPAQKKLFISRET